MWPVVLLFVVHWIYIDTIVYLLYKASTFLHSFLGYGDLQLSQIDIQSSMISLLKLCFYNSFLFALPFCLIQFYFLMSSLFYFSEFLVFRRCIFSISSILFLMLFFSITVCYPLSFFVILLFSYNWMSSNFFDLPEIFLLLSIVDMTSHYLFVVTLSLLTSCLFLYKWILNRVELLFYFVTYRYRFYFFYLVIVLLASPITLNTAAFNFILFFVFCILHEFSIFLGYLSLLRWIS